MRLLIPLLLLWLWKAPATASEILKCGGATVSISFGPPETVLTVARAGKSTKLRFEAIDFIGAECRTALTGKPYVVLQAYCGGSSCRDLDNYGIIDPASLVVVMEPNDWNRDDAARFLGSAAIPVHRIYSVDTKKLVLDSASK
jgi:hypothetical protein